MISVAIVDDHKLVRAGVAKLLEAYENIKISFQFDGPEMLLENMEDCCCDVIIMDLSMPGIGGIQATHLLAQSDRKVIISSMHQTSFHVSSALRAGARGFVGKSSPIDDLYSAIQVVHQGGIWIPSEISKAIMLDLIRETEISSTLSPRQVEVLQMTVGGLRSKEIAYKLGVSTKTVETYKHQVMEKAGVSDITSLVKWSILNGFTGF